jgi:hypothetical protein
MSHIDTVHTILSYLSKIYFNIVHTYILVFLVVSFLLASPPISYMHSFSPHSIYMPCSSDPPWLDHSTYVWRGVQIMKLLIMQYSRIFCHFISLRNKYPLSTLFSNTLSLCSSLNVGDKVFFFSL